jgi:methylated-DNA-[protein]-cysteine S-methyltransferase
MSLRHFTRVFTREVGTPPGRYVEQVRLETARRRLEESEHTLGRIATECGFGSADGCPAPDRSDGSVDHVIGGREATQTADAEHSHWRPRDLPPTDATAPALDLPSLAGFGLRSRQRRFMSEIRRNSCGELRTVVGMTAFAQSDRARSPRRVAPRCWTMVETPIGSLRVSGDEGVVSSLYMPGQRHRPPDDPMEIRDDERLAQVAAELAEYFAGSRRGFGVGVEFLTGTAFQRGVWQELMSIPYGETVSYGELATRLGCPQASRAVGLANGRNPVSIIVPCHRVVGARGGLTGYGGGIERKQWLLDHENSVITSR